MRPRDPYGVSKARAEALIMEHGAPFVILRLSTLVGYGVGQAGHSFHSQAGRSFADGRPVTLYTPDRGHDYLCVRAAATALVDAALGACSDDRAVFNLGGDIGSLHALMNDLCDAARVEGLVPVLITKPAAPTNRPLLDTSAFRTRFGATSWPVDLATGLMKGLLKERAGEREANDRHP